MNIDEIQDRIIEEFSRISEPSEMYEYIINLGKSLEPMPDDLKTDENAINGCQAQVWLKTEVRDNLVFLRADGEIPMTRGILALLLRIFNQQSPEDIKSSDLYFIDRIGLKKGLSPSRANGLATIVKTIKTQVSEH